MIVPPALEIFWPVSVAWSVTDVSVGTTRTEPDSPPPDIEVVSAVGAGAGGSVVGVVAQTVSQFALSITGEMGEPTGVEVVIPEVGTASLAYAVQLRLAVLPGRVRAIVVDWSATKAN